MIKMIAGVSRRPGMTRSEYLAYIQYVHGRLTADNPLTIRRYVQNHVFDSAFGTLAESRHSQVLTRDSVTELFWDSADDMAATFSSEYVRKTIGPDGRNFADESLSISVVAEEVEFPVADPRPATGAKVMHFLTLAEGLDLPTFFERWEAAHLKVIGSPAGSGSMVRRYIQARQLPEHNAALEYFGGKGVQIPGGVASVWFDSTSVVGAFRSYEAALLEINRQRDERFYDEQRSFFVYALEVPIVNR